MAFSATDAAIWTFHACLQAFVTAIAAWNYVPLRPREEINNQPDEAGEKHQQHPEHGAVHSTCFCVTCNPHQKRNIQRNNDDWNQKDRAANTASRKTLSCRIVVILRVGSSGTEEHRNVENWISKSLHFGNSLSGVVEEILAIRPALDNRVKQIRGNSSREYDF